MEVRPDRAEGEGDFTGLVAGGERAAVDDGVEDGYAESEGGNRGKPPPQCAGRQCDGAQPPGDEHGHDGAGEDHQVGVSDERGRLECQESGEADPGTPTRAGFGGQQRPQQEPGTRRHQGGVGEGRHVVPPGEGERGPRGAVQPDRCSAPERSEPSPGTDEEPEAGHCTEEQWRPSDDPELLERRREEGIARVLLARYRPGATWTHWFGGAAGLSCNLPARACACPTDSVRKCPR